MAWKKLGPIFAPSGDTDWMATHATNPVAEVLGKDRVRVFFTSRNQDNRSSIGSLEIDPAAPGRILRLRGNPVLGPGCLGAFDEDGTASGCLVETGGKKYLYYTGWNRAVSVPFRNAIGLAVSEDGGETFFRYAAGPVLDRSVHDPFFTAAPCVLFEDGGWKMWYSTCQEWTYENSEPKHHYNIVYATSDDGVNWHRDGTVCIDFADPEEYVITAPSVIRDGSIYKMWYSYRGSHYRIGYAESPDGIRWTRKDGAHGLNPSREGWDSQMVEYSFVFDHRDRRYMLYCGNNYGRTGLGLAVQEAAAS